MQFHNSLCEITSETIDEHTLEKIKHSSFTTEHVLVCERLLLFLTMQVFVLFPSV